MRRGLWITAAIVLGSCLILTGSTLFGQPGKKAPPEEKAPKLAVGPLEAIGKTQPAPGRSARIAPVPLHPVQEIKIAVGDRVKKDQLLIKLDSDEPEADVRAKKAVLAEMQASLARLKEEPRDEDQKEARAALDNATICVREAKALLERLEPAYRDGAVAEQKYIETRALVLRCQGEERAAQAKLDKLLRRPFQREVSEIEARIAAARGNLEAAEAELEHYSMKSPIDGVVASLNVVLGTVRGNETTVWGEIIDVRQLDVRCDLPPALLDGIRVGMDAQILPLDRASGGLSGKVVNVGIAADRTTGNVPVLVRVENTDEKLRCYIDVKVRFGSSARDNRK
jgi:multidrug resistance efflux pump